MQLFVNIGGKGSQAAYHELNTCIFEVQLIEFHICLHYQHVMQDMQPSCVSLQTFHKRMKMILIILVSLGHYTAHNFVTL